MHTRGYHLRTGLQARAHQHLVAIDLGHLNHLGAHKINLFSGPLNFQDGTPFLKAGDTATDEQVWSLPQLLEGMEGQSSAQ